MAERKVTSEREAIRIAEAVIEGKVDRQPDAPIEVICSGDVWTVTFVHRNPPNTLGPDYDAQIKIDAVTGEVVQFKVGS